MYQALYRKYRPKTFDDVVGQEHVTLTLKNQVAGGRLSHAYLFIGTRGTGKTTCAKILARAVNCLHPENGNPCNVCAACLGIEDGSVLDVVELDAASNNGVDNVRALREEAVFTPASVRKRVYIVDEVHMLSTAAFNALLKILEEPPEHLLFILATTELHKVPATILSRCQRHSFRRIDPDVIAERLLAVSEKENISLTDGAAALLSRLADGSMRDALSLLDQCASPGLELAADDVLAAVGFSGSRRIAELFSEIAGGGALPALAIFDELWRGGKSPSAVLSELSSLMRDLLLTRLAPKGGAGLLSGLFDGGTLSRFADAVSAAGLMRLLELTEDALRELRGAANPRLTAELCLLRLADPALGGDMPALEARLDALERKLADGSLSARTPTGDDGNPPASPPAPGPDPDDVPPWDFPEPEPSPGGEPDEGESAPFPDDEPDDGGAPFSGDAPDDDVPSCDGGQPAAGAGAMPDEEFRVRLCELLSKSVGVGTLPILMNPALSRIELREGALEITAGGFACKQLNRSEILGAIREAAAQILGAPAAVSVREGPVTKAPKRSLDELLSLGNVTLED